MTKLPIPIFRIVFFSIAIICLAAGYFYLSSADALFMLEDGAALKQWINHFGIAGPLILISLMAIAIVMSPIPSAPIALAAGAMYGHTTGTLYIVIGAVLGSTLAFYIARILGFEFIKKWIGHGALNRLVGSQNSLMGIVFISRLLPFVSFDIISYVAGVTPLKYWRFLIATLTGIIPTSFLLTHFGSELTSDQNGSVELTLVFFGVLSFAVLFINWLINQKNKKSRCTKDCDLN